MKAIRSLFTGPTSPPDATVEPPSCSSPFSAEADGLHYCWRGYGPNERSNYLFVYECSTETWSMKPTTGPAHPGLGIGWSIIMDRYLFSFGGFDGSTYYNDMSKLDLDTLQWSKVKTTGSQPIKKIGCGLVRVDKRTLCCIGGYGIGPMQPGSTFARDMLYSDGCGWTNEIHQINLQTLESCLFRLCDYG